MSSYAGAISLLKWSNFLARRVNNFYSVVILLAVCSSRHTSTRECAPKRRSSWRFWTAPDLSRKPSKRRPSRELISLLMMMTMMMVTVLVMHHIRNL